MIERFELPIEIPIELDWEQQHKESDTEDPEARRQELQSRLAKRYPYLSQPHLEFVAVLDDTIDHAVPTIHLPRLRIQSFEQPLTCKGFFLAIRLPLLVYVVTLPLAVWSAWNDNNDNILQVYYPYATTLAAFLASIPAIKGRFDRYYQIAFSLLERAQHKVEPAIDTLERRVTAKVSLTRSKLQQFLSSSRKEWNQVRRAKSILKHGNGDGIFDGSDLEGCLDSSERQIRSSLDKIKSTIDVNAFLPWTVRTQRRFDVCVVVPFLLLLLGIQMCATWWSPGEGLLESTKDDDSNKWDPVIVSSQTFLIAVRRRLSFRVVPDNEPRTSTGLGNWASLESN